MGGDERIEDTELRTHIARGIREIAKNRGHAGELDTELCRGVLRWAARVVLDRVVSFLHRRRVAAGKRILRVGQALLGGHSGGIALEPGERGERENRLAADQQRDKRRDQEDRGLSHRDVPPENLTAL